MSDELLTSDLRVQLAGRALIVCGAGLSFALSGQAEQAGWRGLLRAGLHRCVALGHVAEGWLERMEPHLRELDAGDWRLVATALSEKLGGPDHGEYTGWLRNGLSGLQLSQPIGVAIAGALRNLRVPIATTSLDSLLAEGMNAEVLTLQDDPRVERFLRGYEPAILHLHGHYNKQPSTIRIGEDPKRSPAAEWLSKALADRTLVWIDPGTLEADPFFEELCRYVHRRGGQPASQYRNFWLVSSQREAQLKSRIPAAELQQGRLFLLSYGDDLTALRDFLRDLQPLPPDVVGRVPGGPSNAERLSVYIEATEEKLGEDEEKLAKLLKEHRFDEACDQGRTLLKNAERIAQADDARPELLRRISRLRFRLALALFNSQRTDIEVRSLIAVLAKTVIVDSTHLSPGARASLSQMCAQLGEPDKAVALLEAIEEPALRAEVQAMLTILRGEVPEVPPEDSIVRQRACFLLAKQGRLPEVLLWNQPALEEHGDWPAAVLNAASLLVGALHITVFEDSPAVQLVPVEQREALLVTIEDVLQRLLHGKVHEVLRREARLEAHRIAIAFHDMCRDFERAEEQTAQLRVLDPELRSLSDQPKLFSMDDLGEPPILSEESPTTWRDQIRLALFALSKRERGKALGLALTGLDRWPERIPLLWLATRLLLEEGQHREALVRARALYTLLPGRGMRLLLARCLAANAQLAEAWPLLQDFLDSRKQSTLALCIHVAEWVEPDRVLALTEHALTCEPQELNIHLRRIKALARLGEDKAAGDSAWDLVTGPMSSQVSAEILWNIAVLQWHQGALDDERAQRVRTIALRLHALQETDPQAASWFMDLHRKLGHPAELPPPDMKRLLSQGAFLRISEAEALSHWRTQGEVRAALWRSYQQGRLSFEGLCQIARLDACTILARVIETTDDKRLFFSGATQFTLMDPLAGAHLLLGELELLVLVHLDLLSPLREALGPQGKLLLFADVETQISTALIPGFLEEGAPQKELQLLEELQRLLDSNRKVRRELNTQRPDEEVARERGFNVVSAEPRAEGDSLSGLRDALRQRGILEDDGASPSSALTTAAVLPLRLYLPWASLYKVAQDGWLCALLGEIEELWIGAETWQRLQETLGEKRAAVRQRKLAQQLHGTVARGLVERWLRIVPRPAEDFLPPPVGECNGAERLIGEPLRAALTYHLALEGHPERRLLTADFFVANPLLGATENLRHLRWEESRLWQLYERINVVQSRVLALGQVTQRLPTAPTEVRYKLAELGMHDALGPKDIIDLARRYVGLDRGRPGQLLDCTEWMARHSEHPGAVLARLQIATLYAQVLFAAFVADDFSPEKATHLLQTLLPRLELFELDKAGVFLQLALDLLAKLSLRMRNYALVDVKDQPGFGRSSPDSSTGRLWTALAAWVRQAPERRFALRRAIRNGLVDALEEPEEDDYTLIALPWLMNAALEDEAQPHRGGIDLTRWDSEALSLLAALGPLTGCDHRIYLDETTDGVSIEDLLERGVQELEQAHLKQQKPTFTADGQLHFLLKTDTSRLPVTVAPEAILLRVKGETRAWLAPTCAAVQDCDDGRAHDLYLEIAASPDDPALLRKLASHALMAPFRLCREDPCAMLSWGVSPDSSLKNIEDLYALLGEPGPLAGTEPAAALSQRVDAWKPRRGYRERIGMLSERPGGAAAFGLGPRFGDSYGEEVQEAVERIQTPVVEPAGRLASDVLFLHLAARARPVVATPNGVINLRQRLPGLIGELLRSLTGPQAAHSLAAAEPALLRLCNERVSQLSKTSPLALSEARYLLYRLYGWLVRQLQTMAPDARMTALQRLERHAPPVLECTACALDVLHPSRFAQGRLDYRLLTVLHALWLAQHPKIPEGLLEALAASSLSLPEDAESWSVSSHDLQSQLAQLAARPRTQDEELLSAADESSCLFWLSPVSVSETALTLLLVMNPEAFKDLPEERCLAWLALLPQEDQHSTLHKGTVTAILYAAALCVNRFTLEERELLHHRVASLRKDDARFTAVRWLCLVALFSVGYGALRSELETTWRRELEHEAAPEIFGHYLLALSEHDLAACDACIDEILRITAERERSAVPFLQALGRILLSGEGDRRGWARDRLRTLAQAPRFSHDEDLARLLTNLGLAAL